MTVQSRRLIAATLPTQTLSEACRAEMLDLFMRHYQGVDPAKFQADLSAKSHVILFRSAAGRVCGFTTVAIWRHVAGDRPVDLLFSGDTIIDPSEWGTNALISSWLQLAGQLTSRQGAVPCYWLLTTKGHRTYRFLPLMFKRFWPGYAPACDAPALKPLADSVGAARFGRRYEPATGVIRAAAHADRLTPDLAAVPEKDSKREDVRYFLARNPNFRNGDELLCLARIAADNMTPHSLRWLRQGTMIPA